MCATRFAIANACVNLLFWNLVCEPTVSAENATRVGETVPGNLTKWTIEIEEIGCDPGHRAKMSSDGTLIIEKGQRKTWEPILNARVNDDTRQKIFQRVRRIVNGFQLIESNLKSDPGREVLFRVRNPRTALSVTFDEMSVDRLELRIDFASLVDTLNGEMDRAKIKSRFSLLGQ